MKSTRAPTRIGHVGLRAAPSRSIRCHGQKKQLPVFPLSIVAFPEATTPLHIFEARYRVLFSTLLYGSEGLEEGMAQEDSPFAATRKFGMSFVNGNGGLAAIGTTLYIKDHQRVDDGRLLLVNHGVERFKIIKVVQERPVLVCEVEVLDEDQSDTPELRALSQEVVGMLKEVVRLNFKTRRMTATKDTLEPKELTAVSHPRDVSYVVASFFGDSRIEQQNLLEINDTKERLEREKEVLGGTLKYLSAQVSLMSLSASVVTEGIPESEKLDSGDEGKGK